MQIDFERDDIVIEVDSIVCFMLSGGDIENKCTYFSIRDDEGRRTGGGRMGGGRETVDRMIGERETESRILFVS